MTNTVTVALAAIAAASVGASLALFTPASAGSKGGSERSVIVPATTETSTGPSNCDVGSYKKTIFIVSYRTAAQGHTTTACPVGASV